MCNTLYESTIFGPKHPCFMIYCANLKLFLLQRALISYNVTHFD